MKNILSKIRDNHESIFKVLLFLVTLFVIVYFFPRQINFKYEYSKGKPWLEETIITPFDFPILKSEEELKREIEEVKNENKPVFVLKQDVFENVGVKFVQDFEEKWAND